MATIRWTAEAEKWLKKIYDYILRDNPAAAARVIDGIYNKAQLLQDFPEIGYKYRAAAEGEIRVLLYGHYRITYLVHSDKITLDILGVFHGALDLERYIDLYEGSNSQ